jgi:LysR family hydrogen peroxide-inducible transcriptional activator
MEKRYAMTLPGNGKFLYTLCSILNWLFMTLTQLKYIVAVDNHRHFATAAEKCYVTQPTLSMQIHKLEEELGVQIFDRSKQPVVPTREGVRIVEQARQVLSESNRIREIATENTEELGGVYRIGVIPTIAPYLLPLFLREFSEQYPKVELIFEELLTQDIINRLHHDQLDVGIIATPVKQASIHEMDLYYEPFVGYISSNHTLAKQDSISIDDLDVNDLWLLNEGHCWRDQMIQLCKKNQRRQELSRIQFESGNLETLRKMVEQNYGMTLLPYLAVNELSEEVKKQHIRNFVEPVPKRKIRLAYGRIHLQKNIVEAFKETIHNRLPEHLKTDEGMVVE